METMKSNGSPLRDDNTRGKNKTRNILFLISYYTISHLSWKYSFLLFTYLSVLTISIDSNSSKVLAESIDTTDSPDTSSKKSAADITTTVAEELSTEAIWFGLGDVVTISTRQETPIGKAPSIVTVITAEMIKQLGYRSFVEILRTVPGFELLQAGGFGSTLIAARGLVGSGRVRLMINGHMVNNPLFGDAFRIFDDFPVGNIKRIEIIRGPGSAMYGENAFAGVINIITFDAKDIDGVRVSSGYGSFDTKEEDIVFGETYGKFDVSGMVHYMDSNGFDGVVESDSQTAIDEAIPTPPFPDVSQAPGRVEDWVRRYDLNLRVTYNDIYFEGMYVNKNRGSFLSPSLALTDESDVETNYVFAETGYKKTFEEKLTIRPRIYYDQFDNDFFMEIFPDGSTLPFDTNGDDKPDVFYTYPDGFIGDFAVTERGVGAETPFDYELFDGNLLTLGFEYRLINQTNIRTRNNFHPKTKVPLTSLQDFSDDFPFTKEVTRRMWSVYLQDTWDISDTLNLTLGVRHDEYNDFGNATSPRAGLTWAFIENASLKLLYGEAFHAPSFTQLFTTNQPTILGNPDLDPETIRSYEIGLSYTFNNRVTSSINYFYNDIRDLIDSVETQEDTGSVIRYENIEDAYVQGVETETKVDIAKGTYLFMNYSFKDTENDKGNDLGGIAQHTGNFGVNVRSWKYINTNLSAFFSGKRSRDDDPEEYRDDLPSYAVLNLSILARDFFKTMEVQGTVFNLLDKDYHDPATVAVPDDAPQPGRTFFVGLSYQF
ncbi:MAG: hypothetical protein QG591_250 [Planctomycetota bacterium]|nr:hypothetical protein [Planctomycetota bacterium]